MTAQPPRSYTRLAIAIIVAGVVVGAAIFAAAPFATKTVTASTSSCSGYSEDGTCLETFSYTFALSVNYTGAWELAYQGYASLHTTDPLVSVTSFNGSGIYSTSVTLTGFNNNGLTFCAQAQKLDASTSTLILTIVPGANAIGHNETSLPYGSISYCGVVGP